MQYSAEEREYLSKITRELINAVSYFIEDKLENYKGREESKYCMLVSLISSITMTCLNSMHPITARNDACAVVITSIMTNVHSIGKTVVDRATSEVVIEERKASH